MSAPGADPKPISKVLNPPVDLVYYYTDCAVEVPQAVKMVYLPDGSVGIVTSAGQKYTITPGYRAMSTSGTVDWE